MGQPLRPIPDTSIFDLRLSRRGRRLNRLCEALCSPAEREAFKRDEEAFMARFGLNEGEKNLIRTRDFKGLIEAGMNIYAMLKLGSATGSFRWTRATGAVDTGYVTPRGIGADGDLLAGNTLEGPFISTFGVLAGTQPEALRLAPEIVPSGWSEPWIDGISRNGRLLVGQALNPSGQREPWLLHLIEACR